MGGSRWGDAKAFANVDGGPNSGTVPALLKLLVRMKMRMRFPMLGKLPMDLIQKT